MFPGFGNVGVRSGQQMAYATRIGIFVSSLEFQVGSCLYVTAAVRGGRPRACRTWSQRPKLVPFLGAHTAYTCKRGEVFLGVSNEVRLHRFSSPPFGSPFHPFPSYTPFVSSFLSCPPVFMSGHLILFFVCAHIGPGLSVYVHFYLQF